ncbi:cytochrome b5 reductase 4 isoform X1 [Vanessa cardui]|uniref:cytochrome b5 reductase 4 isoform X1 n=1 Tax=Vanessa cardui TaxID=171605 RepID=UPI001F13419F|nr:cytochrome b5 reductase 4 isoform X1 [Vanessa cardui]XP_046969386.1 cytochrome b5 reductase 4 isoform X1 [Vanessa cardui]
MSDTLQDEETSATRSNSLKISLPTVLCTDVTDNPELPDTNSFVNSESKLSLPSSFGTPTSPLRLSSPLSLPSSPTPFAKAPLQTRSNKSLDDPSQQSSEKTQSSSMNPPLINSGSATGNPRNKCALQPGHSLMDWIRLGNSGKDLTGVGGRIRPVTPAELATHNTEKDAWLAIRGRVYNITYYLPYHPGGSDELMRGAGIDATELFDKVHPWVNYDSLLAKCLVGPLRFDRPDADELFDISNPSPKSDRLREPSKAQELVRKSMENLANCITPVRKKITAKSEENVKGSPPSKIMQSLIQSSDLPVSISRRAASSPLKSADQSKDSPPSLRFDWIQTSTKLTISVYTGLLSNPGGCARISEGALFVDVATNGWLRTLKLVPEEAIKEPLQIRVFSESGKIEVTVLKITHKVWKNIGETIISSATHISAPRTLECRVLHVECISHDTTLLALAPKSGPVVVPLGHHVRVHHKINDKECIRSYTPVGDSWDQFGNEYSAMKLAVKCYKTGVLSPHLTTLKIGDSVTLSGPYGNFHLQKLKRVKILYLIAAGTGITPMLGLLRFMLARSNPKCERVNLLFFNKTEEDILFKNKFEDIARQDERLKIAHVLSNASCSWKGQKGRISSKVLSEILDEKALSTEDAPHFACLCGPTEFTHTSLDLLKKLGMKENDIHAFIG